MERETRATTKNKELWPTWIAFIGVAGATIGLTTSPAITSIGTFLFILAGCVLWPLVRLIETRRESNPVKTFLLNGWKRFWGNKAAFFMVLLFLLHIIAGLYTHDKGAWIEDIRIKLPFFLVPLSFSFLPYFSPRQLRILAWILVLSVVNIAIGTAINYYLNKVEIDAFIAESRPMPIFLGMSHIYFSFILAFAVVVGFWLFRQQTLPVHLKSNLFWKVEKWAAIILSTFNLFALHLFTARTGLVAFYLALGGFVLLYYLGKKKYLIACLLIAGVALGPVIGYFSLSSLKNRVDNTVMDIRSYFNGEDPNYLSISMRMEALKTAWHIVEAHPLFGVGVADLEAEMENQYIRDGSCLISKNWVMPHNQFILFLAGLGIIGLLLFMIVCAVPWLDATYRNSGLFLIFWMLMLSAMMAESLLERHVGITFFVFFWFLTPQMETDRPMSLPPPEGVKNKIVEE